MKKYTDLLMAHVLLSENLPEVILNIYGHGIDLDKASDKYAEIYRENFRDSSIDESLLIVAMLLKEVYSQIGKEANTIVEVKTDRVVNKKLKEFLVSYN